MKAVGCVAVVVVVAVAAFFGITAFVITQGEDQSALTERVELTVINPRDVGTGSDSGYRFDYAYEVAGQWYGAERFVNERNWSPGQPITGCVDPDDPRSLVEHDRLPRRDPAKPPGQAHLDVVTGRPRLGRHLLAVGAHLGSDLDHTLGWGPAPAGVVTANRVDPQQV